MVSKGHLPMSDSEKKRILDLLLRLEQLEATPPRVEEKSIRQVAELAIVDEISRLIRQDWLAVYRNGASLDVVSLT